MTTANGFLRDHAELLLNGDATDPPPFTFQSDISDDDAPDPLTLDEIASASLAALKSDLREPSEEQRAGAQTNGVGAPHTDKSRSENGVRLVDVEVSLPWLSPAQRAGYRYVEVDEHFKARRGGRRDDLSDEFLENFGTQKRKRTHDDAAYIGYDEYDEDSGDDEEPSDHHGARRRHGPIDDYLETGNSRRSTRANTRASSLLVSSEGEHDQATRGRRLRPRVSTHLSHDAHYDDRDELQDSDGDADDPTFGFVQSDIVPTKQRKRLRKFSMGARAPVRGASRGDDSDIEFEPRHRSSRANKNTRVVNDAYVDDDDIYYDDGDRPAAAPRILSMREIFQESSSPEFNEAHRPVCESCGSGDNKGPLVPCQGCSNSYHKLCLGIRSSRDHVVTKVGPDSFVMQCRFCIGISKKKDTRAPTLDVCQGCHTKNPSCAPFSQKQTPKQEEQLRLENDGVDPITPVDPTIIDNPDNVLFRCGRCHRAWHYEHLPHPTRSRDPALDDPLRLRKHRREEYQITWLCKACQDTDEDKVDKIVAWRPVDPKSYTKGQSMLEFDEDSLEYLLKWEKKSYNHCLWLPGAWVHGAVNAIMRLAFIRRTLGEGADDGLDGERNIDSLLRWTEMEAIHDSWITPDIILDVHYAPRSGGDATKYMAKSARDKFEDDLNRIYHVIKIFVKFEGLGYDDAVWDTPPPPDSGAIYDAYIEAYHEYLNGKHFQSDPWSNMEKRIDQFRQLDFETAIEVKEQPKGLTRGKLMEYQIDGLNWMLYNFRFGRSVILADEMGLGKTVQVVAFLASFIHDSPRIWPFLIVVPNATCPNWRREIKKWAPDLRVVAYYGGRRPQSLALEYELFPNGSRAMRAHVVIMSYDSAKDPETRSKFNRVKWAGLIVDEAQALKNDENTLYKALEALRIPFKLLLTGTPLQNNKRELFNLLQFIDPTRKAEELDEQFAQISSENLANLHEIIRPYFLRRTKAMVLTFLPPMAQIIVPVSMTVLQERLCKSIMERNPQLIRSVFVQSKMKASDRSSLSNILIQLRKCLCHPFIYSQAIEDRTTSPELMRRNLVEASSKLMLLEIMLPKLKERGHRVLLFSQFLDQLTILEDFLTSLNLKYERLDGGQSSLEKQRKIDAFNAPDSDLFAMLLSTRAGGVGINLATADTVIILDPDWNPHQDIQALSRAHRIGQRKKVLCFQLVTVDSAEEKILQIGRKKLALDHLLIETMDTQEDAPKDVESVLKHGAAALFGEGKKKEAITYDSAAVDKLLDRSIMEETKTDDDKSAESAFAHARVWANDEGALADDLQGSGQNINLSVWDQILQQRAEEARREAERNMQLLGRGGRRRGAQTTNYTGPRFEFDDGHNEAGAESEHGDGDGDFVGSDKSDGESSEEESAPATGESTPTGSGLRKTQGKGAKEDSKADPEAAAPKKTRGGSRDAKAQAKQANDAKASTTIAVLRPSAAQSDSEEGTQHAHKKGPGRPRKDTGSSNRQPATPGAAGAGSAGHADGRQPNSRGQPSTGSGLGQPQQGGGGGGSSRTGQPNVSVASVVPPGGFRFIVSRQPALSAVLANPVPANPVPDKIPARPCFVCHYCHPMTWECPEMSSEVSLRMALDRLMSLPVPQHPGLFNQMHFFLTDKLRRLKAQNGQG